MNATRQRILPRSATLGLSVICALALGLVAYDSREPLRPAVVLVAIVLGTGTAIVGSEHLLSARGFSLAAVIGVSAIVLISMAVTYVPWWHPILVSEWILGADVVLNLLRFGISMKRQAR